MWLGGRWPGGWRWLWVENFLKVEIIFEILVKIFLGRCALSSSPSSRSSERTSLKLSSSFSYPSHESRETWSLSSGSCFLWEHPPQNHFHIYPVRDLKYPSHQSHQSSVKRAERTSRELEPPRTLSLAPRTSPQSLGRALERYWRWQHHHHHHHNHHHPPHQASFDANGTAIYNNRRSVNSSDRTLINSFRQFSLKSSLSSSSSYSMIINDY